MYDRHRRDIALDGATAGTYIDAMLRASLLGAAAAIFLTGVALAQVRSVGIEQVAPPKATKKGDTLRVQPVRSGAARTNDATPKAEVAARATQPQITRQMYEACRTAAMGGPPPEGVDCAEVMRIVAEARGTPEGTLLRLLGQRSTVTTPTQARTVRTSDANVVAQEVSTGSDNLQGDAAAIAARVRGGGPPR